MAATTTKKATTTKRAPAKKPTPKVEVKREVPGKEVIDLPELPEDQRTIDRLVAMVPPKERLDMYVHRTFEDGLSDFEFFEYAHQTGQNILLPGPTGSGKSHALEAYAAWKRVPYGFLDGSRLTRIDDVFGEYLPSEDDAKALTFVEGNFTLILRYGGVYCINELNMILEGVSARFFTVFDDHRSIQLNNNTKETVKGDERTLIAAAYNPGYAGGRELNRALKRRFLVRKWGYDRSTEENLVQGEHLLETATRLRSAVDNGTIDTPVPTSALIEFEQRLFQIGELRGFESGYLFAKQAFLDMFEPEEVGAVRIDFENNESAIKSDYYSLWFADEDEVAEPAEKVDGGDTDDEDRKVLGGIGVKTMTKMRSKRGGSCTACGKDFNAGDIILYGGKQNNKSIVVHNLDACTPDGVDVRVSKALKAEGHA